MQDRHEWDPGAHGSKSAGQPYSSCAIACSYDNSCTAYSDSSGCYHGFVDAVCTSTGRGSGAHQRGDGAGFQRNFSFTKQELDDRAWPAVTLPHDPLVNQSFDPSAGEGSAFLPRRVVWYRKHFALPEALRGQHVFLYFEGSFQFTEVYLNGEHIQDHNVGYTSFTVRLDNASNLVYGVGAANVLALRVDPTFGSGHWCVFWHPHDQPFEFILRKYVLLCSKINRMWCSHITTHALRDVHLRPILVTTPRPPSTPPPHPPFPVTPPHPPTHCFSALFITQWSAVCSCAARNRQVRRRWHQPTTGAGGHAQSSLCCGRRLCKPKVR
jgi:hypothetical protein